MVPSAATDRRSVGRGAGEAHRAETVEQGQNRIERRRDSGRLDALSGDASGPLEMFQRRQPRRGSLPGNYGDALGLGVINQDWYLAPKTE